MIAAYALEERRTTEDAFAELQQCGIFDLLLGGLRTRREATSATSTSDATSAAFEKIGPKVIRLLKRCRTGEAIEARDAAKLIR